MNEGIPSQNTLDQMKLKHEGVVAEAESLGEEILQTEAEFVSSLKEAEELAKQIEDAIKMRASNPMDTDLTDTTERETELARLQDLTIKFFGGTGALGSALTASYSVYNLGEGNIATGIGSAAVAASLVLSTFKLIQQSFQNLQEVKLRKDLLEEVLKQST